MANEKTTEKFNLLNIFETKFINILVSLAKVTTLFYSTIYSAFVPPYDFKNIVNQMIEVGVKSLPMTSLTSFFTGMVLALQFGTSTMYVLNEPLYVGTVVTIALIKELGPVLTAVVITGRIGAAITAELGTMKVTEQIDALYTLGTNPIKYLAVPRFLACITMLPILTIFANVTGIIGGLLIGNLRIGIPSTIYWSESFDYIFIDDYFHGFIKSIFFAVLIAIISCYKGFECSGGAEGVGKSTTSCVVTTLVLILVTDYFVSQFLVALRIG